MITVGAYWYVNLILTERGLLLDPGPTLVLFSVLPGVARGQTWDAAEVGKNCSIASAAGRSLEVSTALALP